jgi:eukaryotic-like serine/threonine-protein kinase
VQGVYVSSLEHPDERQQVLRTSNKAVYVPPGGGAPGYLLWMEEQTLVAQRFDPASMRRDGNPVSVAEEVRLNPNGSERAAFWASDAGLLVYFGGGADAKRSIVWMSQNGKPMGDALPPDNVGNPALSPNADRVALTRNVVQGGGQSNLDVWVWEFARQTMTRLTFDAGRDSSPVWSPDGRQIVFASTRDGGVAQLYRKDASGAGQEERLTDGPTAKQPLDWRGGYILFVQANPDTGGDLFALPLTGDRAPIPVVQTPFLENVGRISPDGQWLAYKSSESGRNEIYVQAFPTPGATGRPGGRWQISTSGASDMNWRRDGRELYYETLDGHVMAVDIEASAQGIRAGTPHELFSANISVGLLHSIDATADGQRFLLTLNPTDNGTLRMTVVQHWQATLRN